MIRIQLHLEERQDRLLKRVGEKRGLTRAELVREAIDLFLAEFDADDPLLGLIGTGGRSGRRDTAEHHDRLLYARDVVEPPSKRSKKRARR